MSPTDRTDPIEHTSQMEGRTVQADPNRLYIGEGVAIRGEVVVSDTIIVDGLLEGDVTTHCLIVGQSGTVKGKVSVSGDADIHGKSLEKLEVKNLLIVRSTGRIDGSVSYGELQIERGAMIGGGISSTEYGSSKKVVKTRPKPLKVGLTSRPSERLQLKRSGLPRMSFGEAAILKSQRARNGRKPAASK